jgi:ribulose-phosphate 3-epimerase
MTRHVSPSLLAADFGNLERDIRLINSSKASWLHCDIMDGVFVPNISFGIPVVEMAAKISDKPLDVHLMIIEPENYINTFCDIGIDILTIHIEASRNIFEAIKHIKDRGVKAGVTLKPATSIDTLKDIIGKIDLVLIMSVEPGFGGQQFIEHTYRKITNLKSMIMESNSKALIQVDGGIDFMNAGKLYDAGVDILVAGTTVFKSENPIDTIDKLLQV